MEMDLLSMISSVGFPAAMCIYLIWQGAKTNQQFMSTIEDLRKTVENNTLTMQKIVDKLNLCDLIEEREDKK